MDKRFLRTIRMIESSGGKNVNHRPIESGIQAGSSAYGEYGLMPNTIRELSKSSKIPGYNIPSELSNMSDDEIKQYMKDNPEMEGTLARSLEHRIEASGTTDPEQKAYKWMYGHNKDLSQVPEEQIHNDPYVQKFRNLQKYINSTPEEQYMPPELPEITPEQVQIYKKRGF